MVALVGANGVGIGLRLERVSDGAQFRASSRVETSRASLGSGAAGIAARNAVLTSDEISSPVAVGFARPAVIVPEQLRSELSAEEMNCVLMHETAHLERYDDWENLAARAVKAVVGLHPLCWWILRQIDGEREIACDEWVVTRTGAPREYARSLARVIELRINPVESALSAGIFEKRSRLRARIEMLLERGRPFSATVTRRTALMAAGAALAMAAAGTLAPRWIAFAQKETVRGRLCEEANVTSTPVDLTPKRTGDRIAMHNVRVDHVIFYAFHLQGIYQVETKDQGQVAADWFDIDARAPEGATDDDIRLMMQTLLEDRFGLKTHRETRQVEQYQLVKGKSEPKLKASTDLKAYAMKVTIERRTFRQRRGAACSTNTLGWRDSAYDLPCGATLDEIARAASFGELRSGSRWWIETGLAGHVRHQSAACSRTGSVQGPGGSGAAADDRGGGGKSVGAEA